MSSFFMVTGQLVITSLDRCRSTFRLSFLTSSCADWDVLVFFVTAEEVSQAATTLNKLPEAGNKHVNQILIFPRQNSCDCD